MSDQIKPCPLCGGDAKYCSYESCDCCNKTYNAGIECPSCTIRLDHFDTNQDVLAVWNKRINFGTPYEGATP